MLSLSIMSIFVSDLISFSEMLLTFLTIGFSPSDLVVSIEIVQAVPLFTIFLPRLIIFSATSLHELPWAKSFVPTCRIMGWFSLQEWFQEILIIK